MRREPEKITAVLREHSIAFDMKVYPEAGHGFINDHLDSEVPRWSLIMGSFVAMGYHEPSANDARSRIVTFLGEHLS